MFRAAFVFVALGIGVMIWAFNDWRLGLSSSAEPQTIAAADLVANGPGKNRHVKVTDYSVSENFIAYGDDSGAFTSEWDKAWLVILPNGGGYCMVLRTTDVTDQLQLAMFEGEGEFQGMVVSDGNSLGSDLKNMLKKDFGHVEWDKIQVVDHNRHPTSTFVFLLKVIGGIGLCGVGAFFMYLGREELE